jgi:kynurenine formamidase
LWPKKIARKLIRFAVELHYAGDGLKPPSRLRLPVIPSTSPRAQCSFPSRLSTSAAFFVCATVLMLRATSMMGQPAINENKLVDLTHAFDDRTIYWPTAKPFEWRKEAWGKAAGGYWYASASFAASEHLGTHMDSPIHFGEAQATTDAVPLTQLVGPAVVIDVTQRAAANRDYQLSAADIAAWEKTNGRIPAGAIVMVRTGWAKFWPDPARYMGTSARGDVRDLHFPGVSPEAAKILVERRVDGVGIDTASLDHGPSTDFRSHRILNGAGIYGLENVANLDRLPAAGATIVALPMKIRNGTGGPVRIIALMP